MYITGVIYGHCPAPPWHVCVRASATDSQRAQACTAREDEWRCWFKNAPQKLNLPHRPQARQVKLNRNIGTKHFAPSWRRQRVGDARRSSGE